MEGIDFDFKFSDSELYLIVSSLRYAKKNLSGILAPQSEYDSLLSKLPEIV